MRNGVYTESEFMQSITEPELSLLVIDLGDSCVVKVEKGELTKGFAELLLNAPSGAWFTCPDPIAASEKPFLVHCAFERLQNSINRTHPQERDKPVPRIERPDPA